MGVEIIGTDFGKSLDESAVKTELRRLCPGIHFDLAAAIGQIHPFINDRQGVYYEGRHIAAMDRGIIPEFKLWTTSKMLAEVEWFRADEEGVSIHYETVTRIDPEYNEWLSTALKGQNPSLRVRSDGAILRMIPRKYVSVKSHVFRVGWRHTFERILRNNLPGISRESIGKAFGVDMYRFPVGEPDEVIAALCEE